MTEVQFYGEEGFWDPCPLHRLAGAMRDGKWLDIRTEDGMLQRVRIVEIVVRVKGEDVVFRQDWLDGDEWRKHQFAIDSESLWKIGPTTHTVETVEPYGVQPRGTYEMDDALTKRITDTIINGACFLNRITLDELCNSYDRRTLPARQSCLVVMFEMTNLPSDEMCHRLKYKSQMPAQTVRWKAGGPHADADLIAAARLLGKLADDQLAPEKYRRANLAAYDYKPVLP